MAKKLDPVTVLGYPSLQKYSLRMSYWDPVHVDVKKDASLLDIFREHKRMRVSDWQTITSRVAFRFTDTNTIIKRYLSVTNKCEQVVE